jgi:hypothetical protein
VRNEIETIGSGTAASSSSNAADVEPLALVVDRSRADAGFDELDPPPVNDRAVGGCSDGNRPSEVVGKTESQRHRSPDDARQLAEQITGSSSGRQTLGLCARA